MQDQNNLKKIAQSLIEELGGDVNCIELKDTPRRMAKMWKELFKGYDIEQIPDVTVFPNPGYNQIILDQGNFYSFCEHHLMPFFGKYYFGYIPDTNIIGLSKIARIVEYFSSRMQVQERLGNDIITYLQEKLNSRGMILVLKGRHLCKEMRGIKKEGLMITSVVKGVFETDDSAKQEFFQLIEI
jgi:GTP cyclohydrolase I